MRTLIIVIINMMMQRTMIPMHIFRRRTFDWKHKQGYIHTMTAEQKQKQESISFRNKFCSGLYENILRIKFIFRSLGVNLLVNKFIFRSLGVNLLVNNLWIMNLWNWFEWRITFKHEMVLPSNVAYEITYIYAQTHRYMYLTSGVMKTK